tara:strand:- start:1293 stop:3461 length:2169 start_codon:yes stop_codon:yes gene_type:complete
MGNKVTDNGYYKKMIKFKTSILLLTIFLLGFSVVYLPHGPALSDPDAYFQYRMAQYILDDGGVPEIYPLAYYPEGRKPWTQDTLVLPYLFAYTYKLVQPFGIKLMSWALFFPAIFGGGLAAIFLYLSVKELYGKRIGFFSAMIYSFIPLNLTRVYAGTIDKEVIYGLFVFLSLYFFIKGYKKGNFNQNPKSLVYPILSGIFYGIGYANWSGGAYIIFVITLSIIIYTIFKLDREILKVLLIVGIVGPIVMKILQPEKYPFDYFLHSLPVIAPIAVSFAILFSLLISDMLRAKYGKKIHLGIILAALSLLILGLFLISGRGDLIKNYLTAISSMITLGKDVQQAFYMSTVAESQPSNFLGPGETIAQKIMNGDFYFNLQLILPIIPLGILLLLYKLKKKIEFSYIFAIVWISSGFIAALQGKRLLFFLAPSASLIAGFTFIYLYGILKQKMDKCKLDIGKLKNEKEKYSKERKLTNVWIMYFILTIVLFGVTMSTLNLSVTNMGTHQNDIPKPWSDALIWTKENTPEDSVIYFWWDYGYYFQAVANRYTIADGGGNVGRNIVLANMFTSPEDEAMGYIKRFVDYENVPTYMVVSYEEFGKSSAINRIASRDPDNPNIEKSLDGELYIGNFQLPKSGIIEDDEARLKEIFYENKITTYYILDRGESFLIWVLIQMDNQGEFHPEWSEKLLVKLLPFNNGLGVGLKHFELVYKDKWDYVFIYKIK